MTRKLLYVALIVATLAGFGYRAVTTWFAGNLQIGQPVPDLELPAIDGSSLHLSDFRGTPVVLRFSSRTCSSCADDFSILQQIQDEYQGRLLVAAVEVNSSAARVQETIGSRQVSFPVLVDGTRDTARRFKVRELPTFLFVRADGTLSNTVWSEIAEFDIHSRIRPLLVTENWLDQRVEAVSTQLRCQQCQGRSVWESTAESAWNARDEVRRMVLDGLRDDEILTAFVDRYGEWILMAPPVRGYYLVAWVIPLLAVILGAVFVMVWWRRHSPQTGEAVGSPQLTQEDQARMDQLLEDHW